MNTSRSGAMPGVGTIFGAAPALLLFAATSAFAGVVGNVVPSTRSTVNVGDSVTATLTITNFSKAPNAGHIIDASNIFFTPSCQSGADGICSAPDKDVFQVANPKGLPLTACEGIGFTLGTPDTKTGEIRVVPDRAIKLGPVDLSGAPTICRIQFDVKVLKLPQGSPPGSPSVTTRQLARAQFTDDTTQEKSDGTGSKLLTVNAAPAPK